VHTVSITAVLSCQRAADKVRACVPFIADAKGPEDSTLEAIAVRRAADEEIAPEKDDWRRLLLGADDVPPGSESKAAKLAAGGLGTIKKKERDRYIVAVPLISGERILGVLEGIRAQSSFKKVTMSSRCASTRDLMASTVACGIVIYPS